MYFQPFMPPVIPNALFSPPSKATETNTGVVGYLPVPFTLPSEKKKKSRFTDRASPAFLFLYIYNSTTFDFTGRGIGPIVVYRIVSIASHIDTRRRGRAGAIGYDTPHHRGVISRSDDYSFSIVGVTPP